MTEPVLPPPALRKQLAERLIKLRKDAGLTQEETRKRTRLARSTVIDLENAATSNIRISTLVSLLNCYGVPGSEQVELIQMAEQAKPDGPYLEYRDVVPNFAKSFIEREAYAQRILLFQSSRVPGLFQLKNYVRRITQARHPERTDAEIERSVELRGVRQRQVLEVNKTHVRAVIDESALLRGVTPEQIEHLIAVSELPNVELQVVPLALGAHAAQGESFDILFHDNAPAMDVVFLENLVDADYHERGSQVFADYVAVFERLSEQAASVEDSRALLTTLRGASGAT
ncbi:helix-turn-helix domain-containing protein [Lentzea sp. NPDC102401]|uniref:helix-turn-helix domain-containing protein n=1 Tax=Lentzea sp. NPDC102401 TaxID=3364128 RepID=UPI0038151DBC